MSRRPARTKHKTVKSATRPSKDAPADGPGVLTLDLATEKEINGLFLALLKRLALTIVIMMITSVGVITLAHATRSAAIAVFFMSVLVGLLISFWRNVEKAFVAVKQLGIARQQQRRYADAAYALEYFHRLGNMSFDKDGEAHYHLALAYLGLNQPEKAEQMAEWLKRHRSNSPFATRASEAVNRARTP
jgi:hypothetical protein